MNPTCITKQITPEQEFIVYPPKASVVVDAPADIRGSAIDHHDYSGAPPWEDEPSSAPCGAVEHHGATGEADADFLALTG